MIQKIWGSLDGLMSVVEDTGDCTVSICDELTKQVIHLDAVELAELLPALIEWVKRNS